jgi:glycosyltransferase involved in cell wall biosynthesis
VVGCVARLMRWKCQPTLLEAFAAARRRLPSAKLVLTGVSHDSAPDGSGDFKDFLVRRASALGLEDAVVFTGFVSAREMPSLYGALDHLVHPAVEEPFGLDIVEAMASGIPVVAVRSGGVPEIVRDGTDGLLVAPDAPFEMADAIVRILSDKTLANRLALSGRVRIIDAFTPPRQAADMAAIYQTMISSRASRTRRVAATPFDPNPKGGQ